MGVAPGHQYIQNVATSYAHPNSFIAFRFNWRQLGVLISLLVSITLQPDQLRIGHQCFLTATSIGVEGCCRQGKTINETYIP